MPQELPIVGITMGDPMGIGPEIIVKALAHQSLYKVCRPIVLGDLQRLATALEQTGRTTQLHAIQAPAQGRYAPDGIDILACSELALPPDIWGRPTRATGSAMVAYVLTAIELTMQKQLQAVVTAPINKAAMQLAGYQFNGHTEIFAKWTQTAKYAMMLAGDRLRVVLVTIHMALARVPHRLNTTIISETIQITHQALKDRFGLTNPRIAVAGLNPHAGEAGLFGSEEQTFILPAVTAAQKAGINVTGPLPPDTVFYQALNGGYDTVVCMYHDQGLIPFKLAHFDDGVNTTLGLPIIRTSVDHGTAYDIAGKGAASEKSLVAAIEMAAQHATQLYNLA